MIPGDDFGIDQRRGMQLRARRRATQHNFTRCRRSSFQSDRAGNLCYGSGIDDLVGADAAQQRVKTAAL